LQVKRKTKGKKMKSYPVGWYIETKSGAVGTVSKIHYTENDGVTTLCGIRPSRNAVYEMLGEEYCPRCDTKRNTTESEKYSPM
jgi:hypothetical protein